MNALTKLVALSAFPLTACAWVGIVAISWAIARDLEQAELGTVD